jgi:hypothetical protein
MKHQNGLKSLFLIFVLDKYVCMYVCLNFGAKNQNLVQKFRHTTRAVNDVVGWINNSISKYI